MPPPSLKPGPLFDPPMLALLWLLCPPPLRYPTFLHSPDPHISSRSTPLTAHHCRPRFPRTLPLQPPQRPPEALQCLQSPPHLL
ncbi:putative signal peptide protein [Puccinia sorghi]|uniref:Putative signal peptide protein n=1 Tax=Puccinia sorghi TaxID=27349 RepID=A0A0L6VLD9_9BASI|nr:putative signal peptide protein [Puccinia sorghi]